MSGKRRNLRRRYRTSNKRRKEAELFSSISQEELEKNNNDKNIDDTVVEINDYFYTQNKRVQTRIITTMKMSDEKKTKLTAYEKKLLYEIEELENNFVFMPVNFEGNNDNDIQTIIQDRLEELELISKRIKDLKRNCMSKNDINTERNNKEDGISELTSDEHENSVVKYNKQSSLHQHDVVIDVNGNSK